jgi:hypothetical protein
MKTFVVSSEENSYTLFHLLIFLNLQKLVLYEVQSFLDNTFGNTAKNVCYEVNEKIAFGLPQKTMEAVLS